jgi:hypothetical protein
VTFLLPRRAFLTLATTVGVHSAAGPALGKPEPAQIVVPYAIGVVTRKLEKDGKTVHAPVVSKAFVEEQLKATAEIFGEFALSFTAGTKERPLDGKMANLENRADRDAMADFMLPGVVNIYFVESLRDVDDPKKHRMGVTWRKLSNLKKKYVIVAASARETTLAHELGHFLGNDHSYVKNNLMSYDRDGGKVFLDATQGAKSRKTALALFASKELAPVGA